MTATLVQQPEKANPIDVVYVSGATFPHENDHTLVVYCSDPYYMEGTQEFFRQHHHLAHYDQLVAPGGPLIMTMGSLSFLPERTNFKILHGRHALTKVIAVVHLNCSYYRIKYPKLDAAGRRQKQIDDLNKFAQECQKLAPGVEVLLYFAEEADGHVRFTQVR